MDTQSISKPRKRRIKGRRNSPLSGFLGLDELPIGETLARKLIDLDILQSIIVGAPGSKRGRRLVSLESWETYTSSLAKEQRKSAKATQ
jgi:hypothetical protein